MSYSIYYDRAYIRVDDKFIPLANSGSNNCWEFSGKRYVPEKNWNVMNWTRESQFLFSEQEIRELARIYDSYNQRSYMIYKSRNRCFVPGEFERWFINGMKNAYTVEEYVSFGNGLYLLEYISDETQQWKRHYFNTTEKLLKILDDFKGEKRIEIKLSDNRDVYRPKVRRAAKKALDVKALPEYYVLKGKCNECEVFFVKLTRYGFKYVSESTSGYIKPFVKEKDAQRYVEKYRAVLNKYGFAPVKIVKSA